MSGLRVNWRMQQMIDQLGGFGLSGALCYVAAHDYTVTQRPDPEDKPGGSQVLAENAIVYDHGLMFSVNGQRGWRMLITAEANDTYTVRLIKVYGPREYLKRGRLCEILYTLDNVYNDGLKETVEAIYDRAIREKCGGFIPLH